MEMLKKIVALVVGSAVSYTVSGCINATVKPKNLLQRVGVGIGSMAIGSYIANETCEYLDDQIDDTMDEIREILAESEKIDEVQ